MVTLFWDRVLESIEILQEIGDRAPINAFNHITTQWSRVCHLWNSRKVFTTP